MDWSDEELADVRVRLLAMAAELEAELIDVGTERADTLALSCLDEGDQAVRSLTLAREETQMTHARAMLEQTLHVIERLDAGLYGVCEGCGQPIARERLEVFPRATTCTSCAHVAAVTPGSRDAVR